MTLIEYILATYAISAILVYFNGPFGMVDKARSYLSSLSPSVNELFSCMMCMPVNVGIFLSVINILAVPAIDITPFHYIWRLCHNTWPIVILLDGFLTGGASYLINTIQTKLDANV